VDELNGKLIACQILIAGLIARVANDSPDPLRFLTDFRDEIRAVLRGVNIAGMENTDRVRFVAQQAADELFSLMSHRAATANSVAAASTCFGRDQHQALPRLTGFLLSRSRSAVRIALIWMDSSVAARPIALTAKCCTDTQK
jgi:hypothetical protein